MSDTFSAYFFAAGAFVPYWLLSREEISAGAKLAYAWLAQQANNRNSARLHIRLHADQLGCDEGGLALLLSELEDVGLVRSSRGNVHPEDMLLHFQPHRWMEGLEQLQQGGALRAVTAEAAPPTLPFPEAAPTAQRAQSQAGPFAAGDGRSGGRRGRGAGRRKAQPRSKHPFEVCHGYVAFQRETLGRRIRNVMALANHLYTTGAQDDEVDSWLARRGRDAA